MSQQLGDSCNTLPVDARTMHNMDAVVVVVLGVDLVAFAGVDRHDTKSETRALSPVKCCISFFLAFYPLLVESFH